MDIKILSLYFLEKILSFMGKDPMKYKIYRYRVYGAKIGENVRTFSPISSSECYLINVGDNVTISGGVKFITHDNSIIKCTEGTDLVGPIIIGNNCFIGMNTILLPGVRIADNCIIGAGSVVTKSFSQKGMVIAGNPAKCICSIEKYVDKNIDKVFDFSGDNKQLKKSIIENNKNKLLKK